MKYPWTGLEKKGLGNNDLFMAGDDKCLMVGGGYVYINGVRKRLLSARYESAGNTRTRAILGGHARRG